MRPAFVLIALLIAATAARADDAPAPDRAPASMGSFAIRWDTREVPAPLRGLWELTYGAGRTRGRRWLRLTPDVSDCRLLAAASADDQQVAEIGVPCYYQQLGGTRQLTFTGALHLTFAVGIGALRGDVATVDLSHAGSGRIYYRGEGTLRRVDPKVPARRLAAGYAIARVRAADGGGYALTVLRARTELADAGAGLEATSANPYRDFGARREQLGGAGRLAYIRLQARVEGQPPRLAVDPLKAAMDRRAKK